MKTIVQLCAERAGLETCSYTGRGSYTSCLGIRCSNNVGALISQLLEELDVSELLDFIKEIVSLSLDQLGKGYIAYFPALKFHVEQTYEFTCTLRGRGASPEEAWLNAVEALSEDAGDHPDQFELVLDE